MKFAFAFAKQIPRIKEDNAHLKNFLSLKYRTLITSSSNFMFYVERSLAASQGLDLDELAALRRKANSVSMRCTPSLSLTSHFSRALLALFRPFSSYHQPAGWHPNQLASLAFCWPEIIWSKQFGRKQIGCNKIFLNTKDQSEMIISNHWPCVCLVILVVKDLFCCCFEFLRIFLCTNICFSKNHSIHTVYHIWKYLQYL